MKKLSIYIHIPFCESKCLYCDFASFKKSEEAKSLYAKKLVKEINSFDGTGYEVDSIFIGGGTPTTMPIGELKSIIGAIFERFYVNLKEFTIEGNPNSFTAEKVVEYKKMGVTRVSVGVQSFNDKVLRAIGRIHTAQQAEQTIKMLVKSALDVNCDMMIGLPCQTLKMVEADIQKAISLGIKHLSCYSLILEENTPLFGLVQSGKIELPSEDMTVDMYDRVKSIAEEAGLKRYEVSNFGKPCLHNVGYWQMKEYAGFGLSAHSLIGNKRYFNTSNFEEYLSGKKYILEEQLSIADMVAEYAMLSLRMDNGIDIADFKQKYGNELFEKLLAKINEDKKYYNISNTNISIKPQYTYVANSLIEKLI